MSVLDWFKMVSVAVGLVGTFSGVVWLAATIKNTGLNNVADNKRLARKILSLDSQTSEAIKQLHHRISEDRRHAEAREDKIHEKIDAWSKELTEIHKDVLRALPPRGDLN